MASIVEDFFRSPSEALLDSCKKDQLLSIADYFKVQIAATRLKDTIKCILKASLKEEGVQAPAYGNELPSTTVSAGGSFT
jgi:hypothetical protein